MMLEIIDTIFCIIVIGVPMYFGCRYLYRKGNDNYNRHLVAKETIERNTKRCK